jgi:hypothetical protein
MVQVCGAHRHTRGHCGSHTTLYRRIVRRGVMQNIGLTRGKCSDRLRAIKMKKNGTRCVSLGLVEQVGIPNLDCPCRGNSHRVSVGHLPNHRDASILKGLGYTVRVAHISNISQVTRTSLGNQPDSPYKATKVGWLYKS